MFLFVCSSITRPCSWRPTAYQECHIRFFPVKNSPPMKFMLTVGLTRGVYKRVTLVYFSFSCVYVCLEKMSHVWLALALTRIHQFFVIIFWHTLSADIQKSATGIIFSNLVITYVMLLWSEMARFPSHCYSVTGALHRASSTRPLINGEHNCVDAWRRRGIILNICCKQPLLFRATTKNRLF